MFSRLREHFGTAGLIVAIVALVAALTGGAIAANGGSGDGKASASAKAKKGPRGPKGPKGDPGPAGPQGPAGPAGPAGAKGDAGAAGSNGSNGSNGATGATGIAGAAGDDGKSATVTPFDSGTEPAGEPCDGAGGVEVEVEGSGEVSIICNGLDGETGFTDTLPPGKTETGAWSAITGGAGLGQAAISFNIPLADAPEAHVAPNANCPGTQDEPKALPGHFCLYVTEKSGPSPELSKPDASGSGVSEYGALVVVEGPEDYAWGTWAVTGAPPGP
jgi:hypothetical protein